MTKDLRWSDDKGSLRCSDDKGSDEVMTKDPME